MKKAYILFPTVAMLIFFGYWWNFSSEYEAAKAEKAKAARAEKIAELEQDALDRKAAIEAALASQEIRRAERAAKEAKRQKDREERQAAKEALRSAEREKQKLARQFERLVNDVAIEKDIIKKITENKRVLIDDEVFLRKYVSQAQSNESAITKTIQRIEAADKAWEAAKQAAAAAARKKS